LGDEFGSKGIKIGVLREKLDGFPKGNSKSGWTCLVQLARRAEASHGEFLSATPMVLGVLGN